MSNLNIPQIAIIEDDEHIAAIFKLAFEKAGYAPVVMSDGRAAMEYLLKATPSLVILDLHLPFVSGRELLAYIETTDRLAKTEVIVVSADHLELERLKRDGYQGMLKPVGFRQMYNFALQLQATKTDDVDP